MTTPTIELRKSADGLYDLSIGDRTWHGITMDEAMAIVEEEAGF